MDCHTAARLALAPMHVEGTQLHSPADATGACYRALGFSPGFGSGLRVSPYLKLLPMLMGIGSPGTMQEARFSLLHSPTPSSHTCQHYMHEPSGMQQSLACAVHHPWLTCMGTSVQMLTQ